MPVTSLSLFEVTFTVFVLFGSLDMPQRIQGMHGRRRILQALRDLNL